MKNLKQDPSNLKTSFLNYLATLPLLDQENEVKANHKLLGTLK